MADDEKTQDPKGPTPLPAARPSAKAKTPARGKAGTAVAERPVGAPPRTPRAVPGAPTLPVTDYMAVTCMQSFVYGKKPQMQKTEAIKREIDPVAVDGGWEMSFEKGETYDIDRNLALRLLRDVGPGQRGKGKNRVIKLQPADPMEYISYLQGMPVGIPWAAALAGAFPEVDDDDDDDAMEVEVAAEA